MIKKIVFGCFTLSFLCLLVSFPITEHYVEAKEVSVKKVLTVKEIINEVAPKFGQDPKLISKITWCESNHKVVNHDNGHGRGVTGIHKATFKRWLPLYIKEVRETLNYDSTYDQLKMMSWAFSKGKSYRNQWTSYVAYTKGGTYSFHSKLLQRDFTVKCA